MGHKLETPAMGHVQGVVCDSKYILDNFLICSMGNSPHKLETLAELLYIN